MESDKTLKEQLADLTLAIKENKRAKKEKRFFMPLRGRVGRLKLNKGYVTVETIDENKNITFMKKPIIDGTIQLGDTYHAVNSLDIFYFKGKPLVHQPKHRNNPWNPLSTDHQTYGQKYIMAKMKSDLIKAKLKINGLVIFGIVIAAVVAYFFITNSA